MAVIALVMRGLNSISGHNPGFGGANEGLFVGFGFFEKETLLSKLNHEEGRE